MRKAMAAGDPVDLVILDLMLPGEDGLTLARELRSQSSSIPVIMLTGKQDTVDKIVGLELGADDYITKPFDQRELLARIRSVLRRAQAAVETAPAATLANGDDKHRMGRFAGWRIDFGRRDVASPTGQTVHFTTHEFNLLAFLVQRQGRVVTRDQILDEVCDRSAEPFDRSVDVLVGKVRRKLNDDPREPAFIKTIRGIGYMFVEPVTYEQT
ncbi:MAG: response regulator transcription factor, partial [Magnetospirillum sp. WYHS-4]